MAKKATLRDIAQHADVAVSTVSQVLNNKPNVSSETRQRVLEAAADLGYQPRGVTPASALTTLSSVGLVAKRGEHDPITLNPFYSYIIAGAERECQRQNINFLFASVDVDADSKATQLPVMLLNEQVDGVIILGTFFEGTVTDISRRAGQLVVLVDAYMDGQPTFDSILSDNFSGAAEAVTYLINQGHRHIGHVGSHPGSFPSLLERRYGYLATLGRHNLPAYIEDCHYNYEEVFNATVRLMEHAPQITAIFAGNDGLAQFAIEALHHLGLDVPGDVSVMGFDDIETAEPNLPLTTMHVDKVMMGTMAIQQLVNRAAEPHRSPIKMLVTTRLVVRDSVRQLKS